MLKPYVNHISVNATPATELIKKHQKKTIHKNVSKFQMHFWYHQLFQVMWKSWDNPPIFAEEIMGPSALGTWSNVPRSWSAPRGKHPQIEASAGRGLLPPPSNSHHQDYEPFLVGNPNLNLHLLLLLGGGTTQYIYIYTFKSNCLQKKYLYIYNYICIYVVDFTQHLQPFNYPNICH